MATVTPQSDVLDRLETLGQAILAELRDIKVAVIAGGGLIEFTAPGKAPVVQRRAGTRLVKADGTEQLPRVTLPLAAFVAEVDQANKDNRRLLNWLTGEEIDLLQAWSRGDYSGAAKRPDGVVNADDKIPGQV